MSQITITLVLGFRSPKLRLKENVLRRLLPRDIHLELLFIKVFKHLLIIVHFLFSLILLFLAFISRNEVGYLAVIHFISSVCSSIVLIHDVHVI